MSQPLVGNWNYPTAIRFGAGRIRELPEACKAVGLKRPLLVTDPGLAKLPMIADAMLALRKAGLEVALFSDVKPNPIAQQRRRRACAVLRAGKHDGVIAWGGGSGIDTAKAIAFMAGQTRPLWDFEDIGDWWTRANPAGIYPSIAVPTTAGTGSETGRASVITNEETHTKKVIFHPKMMPSIVIADPELTVGLPPKLTAGTGMDAFIHCLEAYCAPGYHPYAEGIAVEGMRLVKENLARAVKDGRDIEARGHMLAASQMGSTAFQKGLGAIHSLSHPVGAVLDTHHGLTNAVAMPYVLKFNRAGHRREDPAPRALARPAQSDLRRLHGLEPRSAPPDRHPAHPGRARREGKPSRQVRRDGRGRSDGRRQSGEGRRAGDAQDVRGGVAGRL